MVGVELAVDAVEGLTVLIEDDLEGVTGRLEGVLQLGPGYHVAEVHGLQGAVAGNEVDGP